MRLSPMPCVYKVNPLFIVLVHDLEIEKERNLTMESTLVPLLGRHDRGVAVVRDFWLV